MFIHFINNQNFFLSVIPFMAEPFSNYLSYPTSLYFGKDHIVMCVYSPYESYKCKIFFLKPTYTQDESFYISIVYHFKWNYANILFFSYKTKKSKMFFIGQKVCSLCIFLRHTALLEIARATFPNPFRFRQGIFWVYIPNIKATLCILPRLPTNPIHRQAIFFPNTLKVPYFRHNRILNI